MRSQWDHLLDRIEALPSLPPVLLRVTTLLQDPRASTAMLARAILHDPALTADLLRLVNSSFYGFPRRITTVTEAVALLGGEAIRQLLLIAGVMNVLTRSETPGFSPSHLWVHSLATGVGAGLLARRAQRAQPEELVVAGLLHDVGKLVEFQIFPEEFAAALAVAREQDVSLQTAEQWLLGFTHTEAGHALAEKWRFPTRLAEVVATHHAPAQAREAPWDVAAIHVADALAQALHLGDNGTDAVPPLAEGTWDTLDLPQAMLEPLLEELDGQVRKTLTDAAGWLGAVSGLEDALDERALIVMDG